MYCVNAPSEYITLQIVAYSKEYGRSTWETRFKGTFEEAKQYFIGQIFWRFAHRPHFHEYAEEVGKIYLI